MFETYQEDQKIAAIKEEVRQRFEQVNDLAHGWEHVERVYKLALYIAEHEGANRFIVGTAALMHDLGRTDEKKSKEKVTENGGQKRHHADISVELAQNILKRYDVDEETQQAIYHAILAHSFSKGLPIRSREAGVVRDADRLDGLGALGIIRWAMVGEQRRTDTTRTYHPADPLAEHHIPDDRAYMLDHFQAKLLQLADQMTTETGKQLARQRTEYMKGFLQQVQHELALLD